MTKKDFKLLGAVFAREIVGYSLQSKSKEYKRLEEAGLVFWDTETKHFKDGLPPMDVSGWRLTHKGNFAYCSNCKDAEEGDDDGEA